MKPITKENLNTITHADLSLQFKDVTPAKTKKAFINNILKEVPTAKVDDKDFRGEFTGKFEGVSGAGHKPNGTVDDLYDALDDAKSGNEEGFDEVDKQNEAEGDQVESEDYLEEGSKAQELVLEDMVEKSEEQEAKIKMKVSEQEYKLLEHKQNDYEGYTMMTHGKIVRGGVIYKELVLRGGGAAVHTIFLSGFRLEQSTKDKDLMVLVK